MKRFRSTSVPALGLGLLSLLSAASPANATTDAAVEDPEPARDAAVENDPVPDAEVLVETQRDVGVPGEQQQVVRTCAAVPGAPGSPDQPLRVTLPTDDRAWARSTSVISVTAQLARESDFQPEQVHVRVVGEPWARFQTMYWAEGAGDCMEDAPCPEAAPLLDAELPAVDRFAAPLELELAQDGGEAAALENICVVFTAFGPDAPSPSGSDAGAAPGTLSPNDANFPIEPPGPALPSAAPAATGPDDADAEKSGCSATAGSGRPAAALWLLVALPALVRRRRGVSR